MESSTLATTASVLSVVDLLIIGGVFYHLNRRINKLDGTTPSVNRVEIAASDSNLSAANERILRLENDIEVLLKRLKCYDELFAKILFRMKEFDSTNFIATHHAQHKTDSPPTKRISIKNRSEDSIFARKEPFIEEDTSDVSARSENDTTPSETSEYPEPEFDTTGEDDMFSYLKD